MQQAATGQVAQEANFTPSVSRVYSTAQQNEMPTVPLLFMLLCHQHLCPCTYSQYILEVQTKKIESFSSWSGMKVNASKCAITGMLYHHASTRAETLLSRKNVEILKELHERSQNTRRGNPFPPPRQRAIQILGRADHPDIKLGLQPGHHTRRNEIQS